LASSPQPAPIASATLVIAAIEPAEGAIVNGTTVIHARLRYTIDNFSTAVEYYIAPLFDSTRGLAAAFNAASSKVAPSGTARVRHGRRASLIGLVRFGLSLG